MWFRITIRTTPAESSLTKDWKYNSYQIRWTKKMRLIFISANTKALRCQLSIYNLFWSLRYLLLNIKGLFSCDMYARKYSAHMKDTYRIRIHKAKLHICIVNSALLSITFKLSVPKNILQNKIMISTRKTITRTYIQPIDFSSWLREHLNRFYFVFYIR